MKKLLCIAAVLAALALLVSCGGGGTGDPADEADLTGGYPGLTALNQEVYSVSALITGGIDWDITPTIDNLSGTWTETLIEKHVAPAPRYAYKATEYYVFSSNGSGNITCAVHFVYDYSKAIAVLGEDKWPAIRDSESADTDWTADNTNFTLTTDPCTVYSGTSVENCLSTALNTTSGQSIEMIDPSHHWTNAIVEAWKLRVCASGGNTLRVIVKQDS